MPLDGVEFAEFLLVPLAARGRPGIGHHAQLRFVFREERPAELLGVAEGTAGLSIQRMSYLDSGRVAELTRSVYRGDAYDFVAELRLST